MPANNPIETIPSLVKHVAMRIYAKPFSYTRPPGPWVPKAIGKDEERFVVAFQMAINELTRQGYVSRGSTTNPAGFVTLTGKGLQRSMRHDLDGSEASLSFDSMYRRAFVVNPMEAGRDEKVVPHQGPGPKRSLDAGVQQDTLYITGRHKDEKRMQKTYKTEHTYEKMKSGVRRAKHVVARHVKRAVKKRPPKGRV